LEAAPNKEMTLRDLARIYHRRRDVIHAVTLAILLLTALYCVVSTPRYEATATVQIQKENKDAMGLEEMMSGEPESASDALEANIMIETQAAILKSDSLAFKTIEDLHLEQTTDFKTHSNPWGSLINLLSSHGAPDAQGATLEDSPARRSRTTAVLRQNLTVKPIIGTRLIEIDYVNSDPKIAAAVVNRLTQALVDYSFQTRVTATNQASEWLRSQLGDLRKQSEDLQKKVVELQRASGVYATGNVDSSGREKHVQVA